VNEDKGTRYRRAERALRVIEVTVAAGVLVVVSLTPLARLTRDVAQSLIARSAWPLDGVAAGLTGAAVIAAVLTWPVAASLPLALRREGELARRFGVPSLTPADVLRSRLRWLIGAVIAGGLVFGTFSTLHARLPAVAALSTAAAVLAIAALVMVGAPWLVTLSPRVRRLDDDALAARLHALAARAGLRLAGLDEWLFDPGSDDANAALIGVVGPRRLLLSDTLVHGSTPDDLEAVVAHELGHHVHGHTARRLRLQALSLTLALVAAHLAAAGPARWFGGATSAADPAGLPWMITAGAAAWLLSRPWRLRQSRQHEAEADAFALSLTGRPDALERVLTRLGARNLASDDTSLLTRAFFLTHPPVQMRIAAARRAAAELSSPPPGA
jgi:STE24 endopeptidase